MSASDLDMIFNPKSIAVIGASDREGSVGYTLMKNLTELGYEGKVFPINIRKPAILGFKAYQSEGPADQGLLGRGGQLVGGYVPDIQSPVHRPPGKRDPPDGG